MGETLDEFDESAPDGLDLATQSLIVRAALRALPLCARGLPKPPAPHGVSIAFRCFRVTFVLLTAARWPTLGLAQAHESTADAAAADFLAREMGAAYHAVHGCLSLGKRVAQGRSIGVDDFRGFCRILAMATVRGGSSRASPDEIRAAAGWSDGVRAVLADREGIIGDNAGSIWWVEDPLWRLGEPEWWLPEWKAFRTLLNNEAGFGFWIAWYESLLAGAKPDWVLWRRIAIEIEDDDWIAGPQRVAERIAEIDARYAPKPVDADALRRQVDFLLDQAEVAELSARSLAMMIVAAVREFRQTVNDVPDEVLTIERLPPLLVRLADLMNSGADEIEALMAVIQALSRQNEVLKAQLRERAARAAKIRAEPAPLPARYVVRDVLIEKGLGLILGAGVIVGSISLGQIVDDGERAELAQLIATAEFHSDAKAP